MEETQITENTEVKEYQALPLGDLFSLSDVPKKEQSSPAEGKAELETGGAEPEKKVEEPSPKKEGEKEQPPLESKEEDKQTISTPDWESDENPFKEFKKRYFDTQTWGNNEHQGKLRAEQELAELKRSMGIEEESPGGPTAAELEEQARYQGRLIASNDAAIKQYGEEYVTKMLYAPDAPFQQINNEPDVRYRIMNAKSPALEALSILKEREFHSKYGYDMDKIKADLRKTIETELRDEIAKEFKEKIRLKNDQVRGLDGITSEPPVKEKDKGFMPTSFDKLFGH